MASGRVNAQTEDGNGGRGSARDTPDTTRFLFQLPLPCPVRLGGSAEARRFAAQLSVRRLRRVAPHADLGGTALHLEQLPPGRLQAGKLFIWVGSKCFECLDAVTSFKCTPKWCKRQEVFLSVCSLTCLHGRVHERLQHALGKLGRGFSLSSRRWSRTCFSRLELCVCVRARGTIQFTQRAGHNEKRYRIA